MRKIGTVFLVLGCLLLAAALCLTGYNLWDGARADRAARSTAVVLRELIPEPSESLPAATTAPTMPEPAEPAPTESEATEPPVHPDTPMPTVTIEGYRYIGMLDVDDLELSLPVMEEWDYDRLQIAPCRFSGSLYQDNMVICAHNYPHHFTPLKSAPIGTEIRFTDAEGREFRYRIAFVESLGPMELDRMLTGDWDLTLFTCDFNGQTRYTVRCTRMD